MATIKVAFALDEQLLAKIKTSGVEMEVSRDQLLILAVEEFLERRNAAIVQAINEAHADYGDGLGEESEEQFIARKMHEKRKQFLADL